MSQPTVAPVPTKDTGREHTPAAPRAGDASAADTSVPHSSSRNIRPSKRTRRPLVSASMLIDQALMWSYHKRRQTSIYPSDIDTRRAANIRVLQDRRKLDKKLTFETIAEYEEWMTHQVLQEAWYEIMENIEYWEPASEERAVRFMSDHHIVDAVLDVKQKGDTDDEDEEGIFEFTPQTPNAQLVVITLEVPAPPPTSVPSDEPSRFTKNDLVMLTTGDFEGDKSGNRPRVVELARVKGWSHKTRLLTLDMFAVKKTGLGLDGAGPHRVYFRSCFRVSTTAMQLRVLHDLPSAYNLLLYVLCRAAFPRPIPFPSASPPIDASRAMFRNPGLNESQAVAVERALAPRHFNLSLIHGPPGTGKTMIACQLIRRIVGSTPQAKILVCAPTQAAIDKVLAKLDRDGVRHVVRIGDRNKMRPSLRHLSMEHGLSRKQEQQVLDDATVIGCTLAAASRVAEYHDWDALIVDDACQATEPEILLALVGASPTKHTKVVLLGDHMQLPHLVADHIVKEAGFGRSLFQRLVENGAEVSFLDTQYFMHPSLAEMVSHHFYIRRDLHTPPSLNRPAPWHDDEVLGVCSWINVQSKREDECDDDRRRSRYRPVEVKAVLALLKRVTAAQAGSLPEIGVLTPYALQRRLIQNALEEAGTGIDSKRVEVCTVDGFQGRRKDIIILSMVRSAEYEQVGFMNDPQRACVALTRAKRSLWVVEDLATWSSGWGGLWGVYSTSFPVFDYDIKLDAFSPRPPPQVETCSETLDANAVQIENNHHTTVVPGDTHAAPTPSTHVDDAPEPFHSHYEVHDQHYDFHGPLRNGDEALKTSRSG